MGARCNDGAPFKGNTCWSLKGCSTVSSRPLSSLGIWDGGQELTLRPPYWSSCWTASTASPRTCTLSTGAAALRWQPAALPRRHLCVFEPCRRGCSASHRRGRSGPRRRGGAELSGGGSGARRSRRTVEVFQRVITLLPHTHPVQHFPPPPHHNLQNAQLLLSRRGTMSAPPLTTPSPAASGSNLQSLMIFVRTRLHSFC